MQVDPLVSTVSMIIDTSDSRVIQVAELYHMLQLVLAHYLYSFAFDRLLVVVWEDELDLFLELSIPRRVKLHLADEKKGSDSDS